MSGRRFRILSERVGPVGEEFDEREGTGVALDALVAGGFIELVPLRAESVDNTGATPDAPPED